MNKKIIIFDIDGTIADTSYRLVFLKVKPKNWNAFVTGAEHDIAIPQTQFIYHALVDRDDTFTIVLTARSREDEKNTVKWLEANNFKYDALVMRDEGDYRKDWIVKTEKIAYIRETYGEPFMAFEDRPGVMTNCYHALGIFVLDVGQGKSD